MRLGSARTPFAFLVVLALASRADADCSPRTHQSTCIDADPLWVPPAPSRFLAIASPRTLGVAAFAAGLDLSYASRPITVVAASPDPAGRDVHVVNQLVDGAVSGAVAPVPHLQLTLSFPFVAARSGTGLTGVTSVGESSLSVAALRDVRLGVEHDLFTGSASDDPRIDVLARLEVALPTGGAFAGARGPTVAPAFVLGLRSGAFFSAATLGARFRAVSELGGARLGSELVTMLGVGVDALDRDRLSIALEAFALPSLVSQSGQLPDGTVTDGTLAPAEWLLSARTKVGPLALQLGGGAALPFSGITRTPPGGIASTEHFAAVTSPELRFTLVARWTPRE